MTSSASPGPLLSVIVPTRDRPSMLQDCLAALRRALGPGDEVIVVDSASTSNETAAVARGNGAQLVRLDEVGASKARNAGWRTARNPIAVFVDDDVMVEEGWAAALRAEFAECTELGFVSGSLLPSPSREPGGQTLSLMTSDAPRDLDVRTRAVFGHAANVAIRMSALRAVGGFDEYMGAGAILRAAEDADLFDRLVGCGFVGRYIPAAKAVHVAWRVKRDLPNLMWNYGVGSGARIRKLLQADPRRAALIAHEAFVESGLLSAWKSLRSRHLLAFLMSCSRLTGTVVGFVHSAVRFRLRVHMPSGRHEGRASMLLVPRGSGSRSRWRS